MRDTTPDGYWVAQVAVGVVLGILVARRTRLLGTTAGFLVGVGALLVTRVVPMYGA